MTPYRPQPIFAIFPCIHLVVTKLQKIFWFCNRIGNEPIDSLSNFEGDMMSLNINKSIDYLFVRFWIPIGYFQIKWSCAFLTWEHLACHLFGGRSEGSGLYLRPDGRGKRFFGHQYSECLFQQRRYRFIMQVAIVSHFAMSCLYGMSFSENRFRGPREWCRRIGQSPLFLRHYLTPGRGQWPTRGIVPSQVCRSRYPRTGTGELSVSRIWHGSFDHSCIRRSRSMSEAAAGIPLRIRMPAQSSTPFRPSDCVAP